jgi:hypothetical protein
MEAIILQIGALECLTKEYLQKGKDQYDIPPCPNQFRSDAFYLLNIIYLFN